ncbi:MAG: hypothetical protein WCY47_02795 [Pusillimonas sp.]
MWADFIAMLAVAALAFCLVFIAGHFLRRSGRQLPRWIMPAAIGFSVLAYSIWNEYTWFDRLQNALPEQVVVASTGQRSAPWAPWTYIAPVTARFIAIDTRTIARSEQRPELAKTELLLIERWQPTRVVSVAFDCNKQLRADLGNSASLSADGTLNGTQWQSAAQDTALLAIICKA